MPKVRFQITMSLDGYVAGPNQSREHPLGEGGTKLHMWALATRAFRREHGMGDDGGTGPDNDAAEESIANVGATIMGRHMFGVWDGAWPADPPWNGWWGDDPPYHHPTFVLTHHAREPLAMKGGTTFHFVTDGIEAALARAKDAARGKDVTIAGGAAVVQQYLKAGLVDEMTIHVAPVLLGSGARLFEATDGRQTSFDHVRTVHGELATHFSYVRRLPQR